MTNFILLQAAQGGGLSGILMIVALFVIFYFFMIRPQQKRQKEIKKFRESLNKGSKIVTPAASTVLSRMLPTPTSW